MNEHILPVGKLPVDLLARLLAQAPVQDERVLLGPGIGLDCAVVAPGEKLLVYKTEPITFVTDEIGWYAVQVSANDVATTGALPRWMLVTLLLPEGQTTAGLVEGISRQIFAACQEKGIQLIGGHTEVTYGLTRPIIVSTLIGEVEPERLVTPRGATPGDRVLLTKGVPVEATAILAAEFSGRLGKILSQGELDQARNFLHDPGISVLQDAQIALQAGRVTAMHDPTEGGLAAALWELAEASGRALVIDLAAVPIPSLSTRICQALGLDPLAAIASGALLLTAPAEDAGQIRHALQLQDILCTEIGVVEASPPAVWHSTETGRQKLDRPARDEIARLYEE